MSVTGLADTRTSFEIRDFPAGQTTIMHEMFAKATSRPSTTQHREITVETFSTDTAGFRLNAEEQRLPFSSSITNTHRETVY
jgi:hypothetical protein